MPGGCVEAALKCPPGRRPLARGRRPCRRRRARCGCRRCRRRAATRWGRWRGLGGGELPGPASGGADRAQEVAVGVEHLDAVVGGVGHVGVARGVAARPRGRRAARVSSPWPPQAPRKASSGLSLTTRWLMSSATKTLPARVEGHAVGEAELARPAAVFAGFASQAAFGAEFLDAVVVVVGDDHLAFVGRDARGGRRTGPGPLP